MEQEIIQEGMGIYLRLTGEGEETVADRMFLYQHIPSFLPMEVTWVNGQKQYTYDISGKVTLKKWLGGVHSGSEDIPYILKQILTLPEKLNDFLLDGEGVVLHEEYLYLDVRTKEVAAVYFPHSSHRGIGAFCSLLESMMDQINSKDEPLLFLIYGMHRLAKEEGTSYRQLKMYMEENEPRSDPSARKASEPAQISEAKAAVSGKAREETEPTGKAWKAYRLPVGLLLIGLLIPLVLWYSGSGCFLHPVSGTVDMTRTIGAIAFFLGVTGYGAWKLWPVKERGILWEEEQESRQKVCLIPCQGQQEPLPVCRLPFLLGRDPEQVDGVVKAQGVSCVHAQILQEGGEIMVMDEESENGSYLNDQRMAPWQKKVIRDGDLLRFGEGIYVVEITGQTSPETDPIGNVIW